MPCSIIFPDALGAAGAGGFCETEGTDGAGGTLRFAPWLMQPKTSIPTIKPKSTKAKARDMHQPPSADARATSINGDGWRPGIIYIKLAWQTRSGAYLHESNRFCNCTICFSIFPAWLRSAAKCSPCSSCRARQFSARRAFAPTARRPAARSRSIHQP